MQGPRGPALVDRSGVRLPPRRPSGLPAADDRAAPRRPGHARRVAVLTALPEPLRGAGLDRRRRDRPGSAAGDARAGRGPEVRWGSPERAEEKAAVLGPLLTQPGQVYDVTSPDLPTIRR